MPNYLSVMGWTACLPPAAPSLWVTRPRDHRTGATCECPARDGISILGAYLRYAGILSGVRLLAAGIGDKIRELLKRRPIMLPIIGPPGSRAILSSTDSEPGYADQISFLTKPFS